MDLPLVSVIINNYNYARFLKEAVDSVLMQTYPHLDVVVVDDGSTDNSREIIASYDSRITPVIKENGGQASAFNAGFAASRGDLICFLDADDVFLPGKVSEIVKARRQFPGAVLYYHKMWIVDSSLAFKGSPWPADLWSGQIRDILEYSGSWWPRPTTSALCFNRRYLEQVLPMPEEGFRLCADAYLGNLAPFLGEIIGLPKALTLYRQHGSNYFGSLLTNDRNGISRKAEQYSFEHEQLKSALLRMGVETSISLNQHLPYLLAMYLLDRKPSFWRISFALLSCPSLRPASRLRQLAKLFLNRL